MDICPLNWLVESDQWRVSGRFTLEFGRWTPPGRDECWRNNFDAAVFFDWIDRVTVAINEDGAEQSAGSANLMQNRRPLLFFLRGAALLVCASTLDHAPRRTRPWILDADWPKPGLIQSSGSTSSTPLMVDIRRLPCVLTWRTDVQLFPSMADAAIPLLVIYWMNEAFTSLLRKLWLLSAVFWFSVGHVVGRILYFLFGCSSPFGMQMRWDDAFNAAKRCLPSRPEPMAIDLSDRHWSDDIFGINFCFCFLLFVFGGFIDLFWCYIWPRIEQDWGLRGSLDQI